MSKHIHEEYLKIKEKIIPNRGRISTIFGNTIHENDVEEMVVAAYYLAKQEDLDDRIKGWKSIFEEEYIHIV